MTCADPMPCTPSFSVISRPIPNTCRDGKPPDCALPRAARAVNCELSICRIGASSLPLSSSRSFHREGSSRTRLSSAICVLAPNSAPAKKPPSPAAYKNLRPAAKRSRQLAPIVNKSSDSRHGEDWTLSVRGLPALKRKKKQIPRRFHPIRAKPARIGDPGYAPRDDNKNREKLPSAWKAWRDDLSYRTRHKLRLPLFRSFAVFRPAAEPVFVGLLSDLVADPDFDVTTCITAVLFFDQ